MWNKRGDSITGNQREAKDENEGEADMQAFGSLQLDFSTWPSFSFPTPSLLLLCHGRSLPADLLPPPHPPPPLSPPDPAPSLWLNLHLDFSSAGVPSLVIPSTLHPPFPTHSHPPFPIISSLLFPPRPHLPCFTLLPVRPHSLAAPYRVRRKTKCCQSRVAAGKLKC